ncbi:uracil-DNA glycosylase family protein [Croceicoccus sp. F390]|uniref:Uracil-DNA glycosylase family protein n=1 Tax=Croceicoccus esteveae TaxID=3075597 RepID=A0ABU2ZG36_9SPHN|nr:uracil-DNA glycosylase family protein [Croceicoccus sp. F390]MDT0575269.1 uracil-DNA glycosylase family protein [Croceicoccus sp. F390]
MEPGIGAGDEEHSALATLLGDVRACRRCSEFLPLGPRPLLQVSSDARVLVCSQAPGSKAHASGICFDDASGNRLREWMGITPGQFYDAQRVAILPMGLCYPGKAKAGDAPPRPECAPLWRQRLLQSMPGISLTLLVGGYAQAHVLGPGRVSDRVRNFASQPGYLSLPHPSWRSTGWMRRNPWFSQEVLPHLRNSVRQALQIN